MNRHYSIFFLVLMAVVSGCANRGVGPQGGPKDTIPPVIVKETPANGSLNYMGKEFTLQFNEYVVLNDAQNQVLVSPPQPSAPVVKAIGKKVVVSFADTLAHETTYAIDFGTAICDNNEKNPLGRYTFAFSTGDVIDSLEVHGLLLNAETLNPEPDIIIGLHSCLDDSVLAVRPFQHVARTDTSGRFSVRNVRPGQYRIYALHDIAKDYVYQPGDGLAFSDTVISPLALDSIVPGDKGVVLRYFEEDKQRHYFVRCLREEAHRVQLLFSAPQDSIPRIDSFPSAVVAPSAHLDTITYWLLDSTDIRQDTLAFVMTYMMSDSLYNLVPKTDSVRAIYRAPKLTDKAREALARKRAAASLEIKTNAVAKFELYNPLILSFQTPIDSFLLDSIHLYEVHDSIKTPLHFSIYPKDSSAMSYCLFFEWKPETDYSLMVDSAAFFDVYGLTNKKAEAKWKIRSLDEYSTLTVKVTPFRPNLMVQVLNEKDQPVRTLRASLKGARFEYIKPAAYYVRVYEDLNGDSLWTTGDYLQHRQPEPVWYFPSKLNLRANWEFEETVELRAEATLNKPIELKKLVSQKKKK